jgi:hypothetical protein
VDRPPGPAIRIEADGSAGARGAAAARAVLIASSAVAPLRSGEQAGGEEPVRT